MAGRPKDERRETVNAPACTGGGRAGGAWRRRPHDLPPWEETPSPCFVAWKEDGTWELIEEALRRRVRKAEGKRFAPTAGIIDSQALKTGDQGGGRTALTWPSKSVAASATCSWTPRA